MSNICIKAEIILGTSIEDAIEEAKQKASALDIRFTFDFNGVEMFVDKNTDVEKEIVRYNKNKLQNSIHETNRLMLNLLTK